LWIGWISSRHQLLVLLLSSTSLSRVPHTPKRAHMTTSAFGRLLQPTLVASARIFGQRLPGITHHRESDWRVLRANRKGNKVAEYYLPQMYDYKIPMYISEEHATSAERIQRRIKRGKMPTKKGAGARATKKKKK